MSKPLALDLFCGAGGASSGYANAGFDVIGVDIAPQPHYPFEFHQADALVVLDTLLAGKKWDGYSLDDFDLLAGSPPCQDYSTGHTWTVPGVERKPCPRLIKPVRARFVASGKHWVIENVRLALSEMVHPVMLCGTSFGLRVQRHRLFEASIHLFAAGPCRHRPYDVSVRRHRNEYLGVFVPHVVPNGKTVCRNPYCSIVEARRAMSIDWMSMAELGEAIPPAYTEWLGRQVLTAIQAERGLAS